MAVPKLAIILINWNGLQDTLECLDSIYACEENNFEIFLVDNASAISPEQAIISCFPKVHYLQSAVNLGFAEGNNFALAKVLQGNFEFVLFLNNDTLVSPNFMSPLWETLQKNPHLNAVQPCIFKAHERSQIWSAGGQWNQWLGDAFTLSKLNSHTKIAYCHWLTGCAMMVNTNALKKTGGFNPQFFAYYEDVELSFRLNENKNQLAMVPNSIIWHKVGGSVHKSNTKEGNLNPLVHFWNWRNRIWVMKKYQSPLLLILNSLFLIPQFLFTCLYFIARGRWIKLKLTFKGFIEGIRYSIN